MCFFFIFFFKKKKIKEHSKKKLPGKKNIFFLVDSFNLKEILNKIKKQIEN